MNEKLKTECDKLDAREALQSTPSILLRVSSAAADALKQIEIESIFDLATSRLVANASRLLIAGSDPKDTYYRYGTPPKDMINTGADQRRIDELRFEGIGILDGLDATTATTLVKELDVETVRDLALWPPYAAARAILGEAFFSELKVDFDPEGPADLLPKSGGYPTEGVFYHTLVLDQIDSQPDKDLEHAGPIDITPTQTPRITINKLQAKVANYQINKIILRENLFALAMDIAAAAEPAAAVKTAEVPVTKKNSNIPLMC